MIFKRNVSRLLKGTLMCVLLFGLHSHYAIAFDDETLNAATRIEPPTPKSTFLNQDVKKKGGWKKRAKRRLNRAKNKAKEAANKAKEAAQQAARAEAERLANMAQAASEAAAAAAAAEAERLANAAREAAALAEKLANDSVNSVKNVVGDAFEMTDSMADALKDVAKGIENLSQSSLDALKEMGDAISELSDEAFEAMEAAALAAGDLSAGMWDALIDTMEQLYDDESDEEEEYGEPLTWSAMTLDSGAMSVTSSEQTVTSNTTNSASTTASEPVAETEVDVDGLSQKKELTTTERQQLGFSVAQKYPLSFHPPPGDFSIVFLGNIFGSVDGALAGSGSQIIGDMFGVFNAAVLAFGGIVLLYSLVVSTGNTAHEGQFIGQKWSSIWIPMRSFVGVGVILPVSSGYCLMQIFVMTVVVQGVGAADSVWNAALDYLNRGGVIIQKQIKPHESAEADNGDILTAAMGITASQVCMKALELKYTKIHETELRTASSQASKCYPNWRSNSSWKYFCENPVPEFNATINIASEQNMSENCNKGENANRCQQLMPSFPTDGDNIYQTLNGICGKLTWSPYVPKNYDDSLNDRSQFAIDNSRTIAIHQMFLALQPISEAIINNSAHFNADINCQKSHCADNYGSKYSFGQPMSLSYNTDCKGRNEGVSYSSNNACVSWGTLNESNAIFNGTELQDAVAAYHGIMMPTLTSDALNAKNKKDSYKEARNFIAEAKSRGWIMSGAYFFQLALLNNHVESAAGGNLTDTGSNLAFRNVKDSTLNWKYKSVKDTLYHEPDTPNPCSLELTDDGAPVEPFCTLSADVFDQIGNLLGGTISYSTSVLPMSTNYKSTESASWYASENNSLYVYLVNANSMVFDSQSTVLNAGLTGMKPNDFNPDTNIPELGKMSISGGKWGVAGKGVSLLYNSIMRPVYQSLMEVMLPFAVMLMSLVVSPMIEMVGNIFNTALEVMRIEGVNPIVALSNMGTNLIEGVADSWMAILVYVTIYAMFLPGLGIIISLMPILVTWMGIMFGVGFTAAFYIPFVPFLVFSFAAMAWFISVIEAMTAAPIVALGIIMPEGHDAFGKSEPAFNLILKVFMRPALMVIGYIFGIILCYVGVWVLNAGFNYAMHDIRLLPFLSSSTLGAGLADNTWDAHYGFWSNIFLLYFSVLTYVSSYEAIVLKAFDMIHYIPDRATRWIAGASSETLGENTVRGMLQEVRAKSDEASMNESKSMAKVSAAMQRPSDKLRRKDKPANKNNQAAKSGATGSDASVKGKKK